MFSDKRHKTILTCYNRFVIALQNKLAAGPFEMTRDLFLSLMAEANRGDAADTHKADETLVDLRDCNNRDLGRIPGSDRDIKNRGLGNDQASHELSLCAPPSRENACSGINT